MCFLILKSKKKRREKQTNKKYPHNNTITTITQEIKWQSSNSTLLQFIWHTSGCIPGLKVLRTSYTSATFTYWLVPHVNNNTSIFWSDCMTHHRQFWWSPAETAERLPVPWWDSASCSGSSPSFHSVRSASSSSGEKPNSEILRRLICALRSVHSAPWHYKQQTYKKLITGQTSDKGE